MGYRQLRFFNPDGHFFVADLNLFHIVVSAAGGNAIRQCFAADVLLPFFQGGKDGVAVKKLLASGIDVDSAIKNAKLAWDLPILPKFWNCNTQASTLAGFVGAYSKIVVELGNTKPRLERTHGGF